MLEWWGRQCRSLVPRALRETAFDPSIADLQRECAVRLAGGPLHPVRTAWLAWRMFATALECRRLHLVTLPARPARFLGMSGVAMWTDLRDAYRGVVRAPGAAAIVVLILAIGIGVNVAVFSFANVYLLTSLPVDEPERVVRLYGRTPTREFDVVSYPDYRDIRDGLRSLALAAHAESPARIGSGEARFTATVELVTGNFFDVMRVTPQRGRMIGPADDQIEGGHPVVVLGDSVWRSRFNADPGIVGATVQINGSPFQVIAVAPNGFRGASTAYAIAELWVPLAMHDRVRPRGNTREDRNWGWLSMIGRLTDAAPMTMAQSELDRLAQGLNQGIAPDQQSRYVVLPASALPEGDRRRAARVLGLAGALTGLVLLAACANLAGVMQARLAGRRRELAVKQAIGAGRGRIVRAWLFETLFVASIGGTVGLAAGRLVAVLVNRWKPPAALLGDISLETAVDRRVLAFTVVVTVVCAAAVGLFPALGAGRVAAGSLLKHDGVTFTTGRRGVRVRRFAVSLQIAISMVLLLAGGLLVRSALALNQVDLGFTSSDLAVASVDLRNERVATTEGKRLIAAALERLRVIPGVTSAAMANSVPLGFGKERWQIRVPGYVAPNGAKGVSVAFNRVGGSYFETMGIRIHRGAVWTGSLESPPGPVAVINDTMARRFWASRDPVGSQFEVTNRGTLTVVGVAHDSVYYELGEAPIPFMYLPAEVWFPDTLVVMARTVLPVNDLLSTIDREMTAVDPRIAPARIGAFEELRRVPLYPARAFASIAVAFGTLVLLLTAVGLYGVVASVVAHRTREIGVRMALGARANQILTSVMRDALLLTVVGGAIGLVAGYLASDALRGWLYGIGPSDPATYVFVCLVVAIVTSAAALAPARRAARIDPVNALKEI